MASYEHEHHMQEGNLQLEIARMLVRGGWNEDLQLNFDHLFPEGERPADPETVAELPVFKCEELKDQKNACPVCLDTWENADEQDTATRMPCNHLFHTQCLIAWLKKNNSCPCCRHEIKSSNEDYEEYKRLEKRKKERAADLDELHSSMFS